MGFSEILNEEELTQRQSKYIANIYKAGNNLLRLTNDLSDLSKLSADKMELIEGDLKLREIVEEIVDLYSLDAEQKNLCLSYHIAADADCCFKGDSDRLKQVISNLVSNSLKFTKEGEIAIVVSATHDFHTKSKIHVDIFDTGIGIKEKDIPKLFREYSQIHDKNKDTTKGTGLGLNLSQKLVTLMGGNIHVRSDYNIGSNFSFNIYLEKKNRLEAKTHLSVFKKAVIISSTKFLSTNMKLYLKNYGIRSERVYGLDFISDVISKIIVKS